MPTSPPAMPPPERLAPPGSAGDPDAATLLKRRDRAVWAAAYDANVSATYAFVAHLVGGDRAAAEEVHQEVWAAAMAGIDGYDPTRGPLRAWLFGIARNQVAGHFRRRRESAAASESVAEDAPPEAALAAAERGAVVQAALAELPPADREALLAKYVDAQPVAAIAARLGRTAKATESLLSRARSRLRERLRRDLAAELP